MENKGNFVIACATCACISDSTIHLSLILSYQMSHTDTIEGCRHECSRGCQRVVLHLLSVANFLLCRGRLLPINWGACSTLSSMLLQFRKRTKPLWNRQLLSKLLHKTLETSFAQETWKLIFTCGDAWHCLCAWPLQALIFSLVLICSASHPYLCYWFLLFL